MEAHHDRPAAQNAAALPLDAPVNLDPEYPNWGATDGDFASLPACRAAGGRRLRARARALELEGFLNTSGMRTGARRGNCCL